MSPRGCGRREDAGRWERVGVRMFTMSDVYVWNCLQTCFYHPGTEQKQTTLFSRNHRLSVAPQVGVEAFKDSPHSMIELWVAWFSGGKLCKFMSWRHWFTPGLSPTAASYSVRVLSSLVTNFISILPAQMHVYHTYAVVHGDQKSVLDLLVLEGATLGC